MKCVLPAMLILIVVVPQKLVGQTYGLTLPEQRTFRMIANCRYEVLKYTPIPELDLVQEKMPVASPEDALRSHISAEHRADYEWWISTFDAGSAEKIESRHRASQVSPSQWRQNRKAEALASPIAKLALVEWIHRGRYVLVHYRLKTKATSPRVKETDLLAAFKIADGSWKVTLDLERDPVMLHHLSGRREITTVAER